MLFICIFSGLLFSSCYDFRNIETPETLSVSSNARYQLPAGTLSFNLEEQMSALKLREILGKNSENASEEAEQDDDGESAAANMSKSIEVYDYHKPPEDKVYRYIINYPVKEIPLGFSASGDLSNINIARSVEISGFISTIEDEISDIKIDGQTITIPEPGPLGPLSVSALMEKAGLGDPAVDFNITAPDFETMTLKSGTLTVTFEPDNSAPSADFEMPVQISLLTKDASPKVIETSGVVDCARGNSVSLDLAGKGLRPEMQISLDGAFSGGVLLKQNKYKISFRIENLAVSSVTGLNLPDSPSIPIDEEFSISENSALKQADIKKGSIGLAFTLPEGWSGMNCQKSEFSMSGAITVNQFEDDENEENKKPNDFVRKVSDLEGAGLNLNTEEGTEVRVTGALELTVKNATIVFHDEGDELSFEFNLAIDEIGKILIDLRDIAEDLEKGDTIETGFNLSTLMGDFFDGNDTTNLIQNIKFPEEDSVKAYLYINQSSDNKVLENLKFGGTFSAVYNTKEETDKEVPLSGFDSNTLPVRKKSATFASLADENYIIESDELFQEDKYTAKIANMAAILNDQPDNLRFKYEIGMRDGENYVELDNDDFKNLTNGGFSISLAIELPLQIIFDDVTDSNSESEGTRDNVVTIDNLLELTGNAFEDDMLKREGASEAEDWMEYSPILDSMALKYSIKNPTALNNLTVTFLLETKDDSGNATALETVEAKKLETANGDYTIEFSREEVEEIFRTYPIIPKIKAEFGDADGKTIKAFERKSVFNLRAILQVKTDGTIKVWDKNK